MIRFLISAFAALALVATASAATPVGPYKLDAKGKCHAANGPFVKQSLCGKSTTAVAAAKPMTASAAAKPTTAAASTKRCKDPKTSKFVKCGTPGSVPA